MKETKKYYVTITDEDGNKIIDNEEAPVSICKESEIRKYENGIGFLHVWFEIPKFHFYKKENIPEPEFNIGDKVKTKTGKSIRSITRRYYSLKRNKWFYGSSMTKSSGVEDYQCGDSKYFKKVEGE